MTRPALVRSQPLIEQRDDEVGGLGCGDAVVSGQPPLRDLTDQHHQGEGHQPRRSSHHLTALLGSDDQGFDVVDEPFVNTAEALVEPFVQLVGVAEQQLGGGAVDLEELERRPQGCAKRRLGVFDRLFAALGQRDRNVGPQGILLGRINAWNKASFESKSW